ncbi:MAG: uroporphyrinogen decarboxylase family protein [Caldilineales bacterium]
MFYHSDGNYGAILPELVEIGVNVVNPIQPDCMDAAAIRAEFGSRLALWGTVGTANTWDHGTPDDIRREVQQRLESLGQGGLLLAPAYDVDFTPLENLRAFVDAVRDVVATR